MRFQVLRASSVKMIAFWDIAQYTGTADYRERRKLAEETVTGTEQTRYGRCLEKGRGE
jgi:hypothetical protein